VPSFCLGTSGKDNMTISTKELYSIIGEQLVQLRQFNNLIEMLKKDNDTKSKEISNLKSELSAYIEDSAEENVSQ
jgi:hypothetical protein